MDLLLLDRPASGLKKPAFLLVSRYSKPNCFKMAALRAQKACFGQQVQSRSAIRAPAARSSVVVRAAADRKLWAPDVVAPSYLDGSLAGDYGER